MCTKGEPELFAQPLRVSLCMLLNLPLTFTTRAFVGYKALNFSIDKENFNKLKIHTYLNYRMMAFPLLTYLYTKNMNSLARFLIESIAILCNTEISKGND